MSEQHEYRFCEGKDGCGRRIPAELFSRANQHAPGCHVRRSAIAKVAAAKKKARRLRAERAAATRRSRSLAVGVA